MVLQITEEARKAIIAHAQEDAPIEACGYLAEQDGVVVKAIRLVNVDASPEHFSFDPKEQFAVVRTIRNSRQRLKAVYHSHPASPARPSQEDIRLAFDDALTYVIVSLVSDAPDVKAFRIRGGVVESEPIEVIAAKR